MNYNNFRSKNGGMAGEGVCHPAGQLKESGMSPFYVHFLLLLTHLFDIPVMPMFINLVMAGYCY